MTNTILRNKHDYAVSLRKRINKPTVWKDILEVLYTDAYTFVRGALTTEPTLTSHTRGTAYAYGDMTISQDTGTISTSYVVPSFIDWADIAQQSYVSQMEMATRQGKIVDEGIESLIYGAHGSWTDFGSTDLGNSADDDTTQIEISATNIDNLVRQVKRKVHENNGVDLSVDNGFFFTWTASEWAMLEEFAMANGFQLADLALKNGVPAARAFHYFGVDHYLTTQHTANHRFAGIKKMGAIGILRDTYGVPHFNRDPAGPSDGGSTNALSGLGIVTRVDYGLEWCGTSSYFKEFMVDINATT